VTGADQATSDLISRARAGNGDAFAELTGPYRSELHQHCTCAASVRHAACDRRGCRPSATSGGQRREQTDLRVFEAAQPGFTQQANGAPGPGGVGEHDAKFVVESFRSDDLAMADALVEITSSRVVKPGGGRVTLRWRHHNRQGQ
jgi:hypothetical protein